MCRTEKQLLFPVNKNRKALRPLAAKLLDFLPSFLINPSQEYLISFVLECHTLIIQRGKWNSLLQKLLELESGCTTPTFYRPGSADFTSRTKLQECDSARPD